MPWVCDLMMGSLDRDFCQAVDLTIRSKRREKTLTQIRSEDLRLNQKFSPWISKAVINLLLKEADEEKLCSAGDDIPRKDSFTLYRGVAGKWRSRRVNGYSWTDSVDVAAWFAKRFEYLDDPAVFKIVVSYDSIRKREALQTGRGEVTDIIFPRNGLHMPQNHARRIFKSVLKAAGLPDHRLHNTRHSYASIMLKNGASLDYVKRMLGHTDIAMTSNIYGHLMPNRDRTQVNLLGDSILNPRTQHAPKNEKAVTR